MGWDMPWYSAQDSLDALLVGRRVGMFHLVCYLRHGDKVFETFWTNGRGVEAMNNSYGPSPSGPAWKPDTQTTSPSPAVDCRQGPESMSHPSDAAHGPFRARG